MGTVSARQDENVLELNSGDGRTALGGQLMELHAMPKIAKRVVLVGCILYHNEKFRI